MSTDHGENFLLLEGDLFCCPICYTEAHRIGVGGGQDDDNTATANKEEENDKGDGDSDGETIAYESDSDSDVGVISSDKLDPMSVILGVGLKGASAFCFEKLCDVQEHVKDTHGFDYSVINGGDLFHRFRIRASDGLLQRWLHHQEHLDSIPSYWGTREKDAYNTLAHYVSRNQLVLDAPLLPFGHTFHTRAKNIWSVLSMPYLPATDDEDTTDDNENGTYTYEPRPMPMLDTEECHPEERVIEFCRQRNGPSDQDTSSHEDSHSSEAEEDDEYEYQEENGHEESYETNCSSEDETNENVDTEDDWLLKRKTRPTAAGRKCQLQRALKYDSDAVEEPSELHCTEPKKRKRISDDEEEVEWMYLSHYTLGEGTAMCPVGDSSRGRGRGVT